jgi:two-component system, response regulator RegA
VCGTSPMGSANPPAERPALLLVDDDDDLSRVLIRALDKQGYVVHRARTGDEALALIPHVSRLDAAVVDLVLPGAGGLDVVRSVRDAFPRCRIVAITGLAEPAMERAFRAAGADAFLPKPVELPQLLEAAAPRG